MRNSHGEGGQQERHRPDPGNRGLLNIEVKVGALDRDEAVVAYPYRRVHSELRDCTGLCAALLTEYLRPAREAVAGARQGRGKARQPALHPCVAAARRGPGRRAQHLRTRPQCRQWWRRTKKENAPLHFLHSGASLSDCHTGAACVPVQRRGLDCLRRRGGDSQKRHPHNAAGQNGKAAALQIMQGAEGRGARYCTRLPGAVVTRRPPPMTFHPSFLPLFREKEKIKRTTEKHVSRFSAKGRCYIEQDYGGRISRGRHARAAPGEQLPPPNHAVCLPAALRVLRAAGSKTMLTMTCWHALGAPTAADFGSERACGGKQRCSWRRP